jgi:hypothetical protein
VSKEIDIDKIKALDLEPGHYKTLIERLEWDSETTVAEYLIPFTLEGKDREAMIAAAEITQNDFWIERFTEDMKDPQPEWEPTPQNVDSACLSVRHDFGLLGDGERKLLRLEAIEWLNAWRKEGLVFRPTTEIE